jgi:hypothetical protein
MNHFRVTIIPALVGLLVTFTACGYHFGPKSDDAPLSKDVARLTIASVINNTTITGIETELTNELRNEFALSSRIKLVASDGDAVLTTLVESYKDTPVAYKADGKELTRVGSLSVICSLVKSASKEVRWKRDFSSSHSYLVTDSISVTLSNRRKAISHIIRDLVVRIQSALSDGF